MPALLDVKMCDTFAHVYWWFRGFVWLRFNLEESAHVMTSLGADKLVVPEEKMADHEEQLSDEEKVTCRLTSACTAAKTAGALTLRVGTRRDLRRILGVPSAGAKCRNEIPGPDGWCSAASASVFLAQLPLRRRLLVRSGLKIGTANVSQIHPRSRPPCRPPGRSVDRARRGPSGVVGDLFRGSFQTQKKKKRQRR